MEHDLRPQTERTEYLTEKRCAERLSVTRETLSRWRRGGGLPFIALGDGPRPRIRYDWPRVEAWCDARTAGAKGAPAGAGSAVAGRDGTR